jgi:hypothetical protein
MLLTALVSFMIAFFGQSYDPTWDGIPVFMWLGIISAALAAVGVVYAMTMDKTHPIYAGQHGHRHLGHGDHAHSHA